MNNIFSDEIIIGVNTKIESSAIIRGINGNAKKIIIGDNCYIGHNVQVICNEFSLGDYSKIHHGTNIHGNLPGAIGHNAWIGQYSILDTTGGLNIGNNCGIGAHSQLWSHIKYGDTLEGCRFLNESPLLIGNDVWFVGHCIVSPIIAEDKSMALAGSVVTKNMLYNNIYAGSPAKSISNKSGGQFTEVSLENKLKKMRAYLEEFTAFTNQIKIVDSNQEINFNDDITYFNVQDRTYTKKGTQIEILFMKFLLPARAKFIPIEIKTNDTI